MDAEEIIEEEIHKIYNLPAIDLTSDDILFTIEITDKIKKEIKRIYLDFFTYENVLCDVRQFYNCNSCLDALYTIYSIVVLNKTDFKRRSIIDIPKLNRFSPIFDEIFNFVSEQPIKNIFVHDQQIIGRKANIRYYGTIKTLYHFYLNLPPIFKPTPILRHATIIGDKNTNKNMLISLLEKYNKSHINRLQTLFDENTNFSRASQQREPIKFITSFFKDAFAFDRKNVLHYYSASAIVGFINIFTSGILDPILNDIKQGSSDDVLYKIYNDMIDPCNYRRPTALPTLGNIEALTTLLKSMNLTEDDLKIKYFTTRSTFLDENAIYLNKKEDKGMFGNLRHRSNNLPINKLHDIITEISIGKFITLLSSTPNIKNIHIHLPHNTCHFPSVFTTPNNPSILQYKITWFCTPMAYYFRSLPTIHNNLHKVNSIIPFPCQLEEKGYLKEKFGTRYLIEVEGFQYIKEPIHNPLFPELLKGEFHGYGKTIEEFNKQNQLYPEPSIQYEGIVLQGFAGSTILKTPYKFLVEFADGSKKSFNVNVA